MLFTYKSIINNLNIYNILVLKKKDHAFYIKKTKFINLEIIKKKVLILLPKENFEKDKIIKEKLA